MLRPICLLLTVSMLQPLLATASPTEAERAYLRCTEEKARQSLDVQQCLDEVGRHAWYPLDEAMCAANASILEWAFDQEQELSYKLLYFNERCVRLGYPHFATDLTRAREPDTVAAAENPFGSPEEQQRALAYTDWSLYSDPEGEFSIEFPTNWRVIDARDSATKLKIASPLDATCAVITESARTGAERTIKDDRDFEERHL